MSLPYLVKLRSIFLFHWWKISQQIVTYWHQRCKKL